MNARRISQFASGIAVVALVACGGGGGGTGTSAPKAAVPLPTSSAALSGATGQATFRIDTGANGTTATVRRAQYISPATVSATISIGANVIASIPLTPNSPGCTTTANGTSCAVTLTVPAGQETFTVSTYSASNALLSTATANVTIVQNTTNTVSLALNGVVASATAILGTTTATAGVPGTTSVNVTAFDAAGKIIVGPGSYTTPITLTDSDSSGATTLSTTTIGAPGATATLTYTGRSLLNATITPTVGGTPGLAAVFAPSGYSFASYTLTQGNGIEAIATNPIDGNLWFAERNMIGHIATNGTGATYFTDVANDVPTDDFYALAADTTGTMWYGGQAGFIGSVTTAGTVTPVTSLTLLPNGTCPASGGSSVPPESFARRSGQGVRQRQLSPIPIQTCGAINWMAADLNGTIWFSDDYGMIGRINPDRSATEWDLTSIYNLPSQQYVEPEQFAFGSDGNLYVVDDNLSTVSKISISGGSPTLIASLSIGNCGGYALSIGPDNNVYATTQGSGNGSNCDELAIVPTGITPNTAFAAGSLQFFDLNNVNNADDIYVLTSSPGGVWAGSGEDYNALFRFSNFAVAPAAAVPVISTVSLPSNGTPFLAAIGPDNSVWTSEYSYPDTLVKTIYGTASVGAQSVKRLTAATKRVIASTTGGRRSSWGAGRGLVHAQAVRAAGS